MDYRLVESEYLGIVYTSVVRTDDNGIETHIPVDEENSDYQAYLAHLREQN